MHSLIKKNIKQEVTLTISNRPSSVNLKPLVHIKHIKVGNKCHTQDNTDTRENPSVWIDAREE